MINTKKIVEGSVTSIDDKSQSGSIVSKHTSSFRKTGGFHHNNHYKNRIYYENKYKNRYKGSMLKLSSSSKYNLSGVYVRRNAQRVVSTPSNDEREEKIKSLLNSNSIQRDILNSNDLLTDIQSTHSRTSNKSISEGKAKTDRSGSVLELISHQKVKLRSRANVQKNSLDSSAYSARDDNSDYKTINMKSKSAARVDTVHPPSSKSKNYRDRIRKISPFLKSLGINTTPEDILTINNEKLNTAPHTKSKKANLSPNKSCTDLRDSIRRFAQKKKRSNFEKK